MVAKKPGSERPNVTSPSFSAAERAAMRARAKELKAQASKEGDERELIAKIAEMQPSSRAMAERLHRIIHSAAPDLSARTWYGMPAYAKNGQVVCFFQPAEKFGTRYSTIGFS
ncbi:protein containing DUF1801, partial [mine drainage metagenome]